MNYRIFIDDERYPTTPDWMLARSSYDAIYFVTNYGLPYEIAFDHDLGGVDGSMNFVHWLINYLQDNDLKFPHGFKYSIHSQNPVGAQNIDAIMRNAIEEIGVDESPFEDEVSNFMQS